MKKKGNIHQDRKLFITPPYIFVVLKSGVRGYSRADLEAGRNGLGLCTARDESKSCRCVFSRPS